MKRAPSELTLLRWVRRFGVDIFAPEHYEEWVLSVPRNPPTCAPRWTIVIWDYRSGAYRHCDGHTLAAAVEAARRYLKELRLPYQATSGTDSTPKHMITHEYDFTCWSNYAA